MMNLAPVAADYIRTHRADCSDAEIRKALKEQGFSDEVLDDAFHAVGLEPEPAAPPVKNARFLRALVWLMAALSVLFFLGAIALFLHKFNAAR